MRMQRTTPRHRRCAGLLALALLAGCATRGPDLPGQAPPPEAAGSAQAEALRARYDADLAACRAYAQQIDVVRETLDGIVEGALVAAALVWGLGRSSDAVQDWAVAGGVLGAGSRSWDAAQRRRQVVATCMSGRGHTLAAQPVPAPVQPAAQPAPFLPARASGTDGFNAERLARDQSCSAAPVAALVAKGPGFENYSVPCANGDALAVRCEFGNCRVLR